MLKYNLFDANITYANEQVADYKLYWLMKKIIQKGYYPINIQKTKDSPLEEIELFLEDGIEFNLKMIDVFKLYFNHENNILKGATFVDLYWFITKQVLKLDDLPYRIYFHFVDELLQEDLDVFDKYNKVAVVKNQYKALMFSYEKMMKTFIGIDFGTLLNDSFSTYYDSTKNYKYLDKYLAEVIENEPKKLNSLLKLSLDKLAKVAHNNSQYYSTIKELK